MLLNRYLIATIFVLIVSSCMSGRRTTGTYSWMGNKTSPDFYQIKLNADYTYTYYGWSDIMGADTVEGNWKRSGDTLYFSSQERKEKALITSIDKRGSPNNSSKITILDVSDSSYVLGSRIYLDNDDGQFVDSLGSIHKDGIIEEIKIEYLSYLDSVVVQATGSNYFEVYLDFKANKLDQFYVNPTWLKRGRRLIQLDSTGNKVEGGVYKKLNSF